MLQSLMSGEIPLDISRLYRGILHVLFLLLIFFILVLLSAHIQRFSVTRIHFLTQRFVIFDSAVNGEDFAQEQLTQTKEIFRLVDFAVKTT